MPEQSLWAYTKKKQLLNKNTLFLSGSIPHGGPKQDSTVQMRLVTWNASFTAEIEAGVVEEKMEGGKDMKNGLISLAKATLENRVILC